VAVFPAPRDHLQRPRHVLAQLAQARAAAAFALCRRIDHYPFTRQMVGEGVALGTAAREAAHRRRPGDHLLRRQLILGGACFQLLEGQRQLVDQTPRPFRGLPVLLALQLGDHQLLMGDQRRVLGRLGARHSQFRLDMRRAICLGALLTARNS